MKSSPAIAADAANDLGGEAACGFRGCRPSGRRGGCEKGVQNWSMQRMIGGEKLDAVETRFLGTPGGGTKPSITSSISASLMRVAAVGIVKRGQARGRPVGLEGIVEIAMLADMIELMADHRAMAHGTASVTCGNAE